MKNLLIFLPAASLTLEALSTFNGDTFTPGSHMSEIYPATGELLMAAQRFPCGGTATIP